MCRFVCSGSHTFVRSPALLGAFGSFGLCCSCVEPVGFVFVGSHFVALFVVFETGFGRTPIAVVGFGLFVVGGIAFGGLV